MSRTLAFEKWEGLGNDFVLMGLGPAASSDDGEPTAEVARTLCDRRRGIGADGIIFVRSAMEGGPAMIVLNADGSRPEMCGNGLRCAAGYLVEHGVFSTEVTVATDAGPRACRIERAGPGLFDVLVDMGTVTIGGPLAVEVGGRTWHLTTASAGNPHAVTFEPADDATIDRVGPVVERTPPGGTNVEFCRTTPEGIDVVVWERGVGRTLACGTGACAVAAVACAEGRARWGEPVRVRLPGGTLEVRVDASGRVAMRGPARRVFTGEVVLP